MQNNHSIQLIFYSMLTKITMVATILVQSDHRLAECIIVQVFGQVFTWLQAGGVRGGTLSLKHCEMKEFQPFHGQRIMP